MSTSILLTKSLNSTLRRLQRCRIERNYNKTTKVSLKENFTAHFLHLTHWQKYLPYNFLQQSSCLIVNYSPKLTPKEYLVPYFCISSNNTLTKWYLKIQLMEHNTPSYPFIQSDSFQQKIHSQFIGQWFCHNP